MDVKSEGKEDNIKLHGAFGPPTVNSSPFSFSSCPLFFLQNEVAMLLKPISEKIQEIQNFRERNRGSKMFNHLSAVSESIPALGWIAVVSDTWYGWEVR